MTTQKLTWVGMTVGDHVIEKQLGDGTFFWVYQGTDSYGQKMIFKVAKPDEYVDKVVEPNVDTTEAKFVYTGAVMNVRPHANALLEDQVARFERVSDQCLVKTSNVGEIAGLPYVTMPFIEGTNLRSLANANKVHAKFLLNFLLTMERLSSNSGFTYHGDLKPENIIVGGDRITILDPGFFGVINCQEGASLQCAVTTTLYYPLLEPNDLLAFGILLWEIALGQHPFNTAGSDDTAIGEDVKAWISTYEAVGQYFLSPLANIRRPSRIKKGLNAQFENLLLKGLHLRIDEAGTIRRGESFKSFGEFARALKALL